MAQKVGGVEFDVDVDASGVASGSKSIQSDLSKVESAFKQVDVAADASGANMSKAAVTGSKGMARLRGAAGNLGFQLQDIAVQAQAGTNALVILGQQGSQIAGAFGPTGAIVGGVIAVGAAIASVVFNTNDLSDSADELTEKLKELSKTNELTINQQKFLAQVEKEEKRAKDDKVKSLEDERKALLKNVETGDWYQRVVLAASVANQGLASFLASKLIPTLTDEQKRLVEINAELDTLEGKKGALKFDPEGNREAILSYRDRIVAIQAALDQESSTVINSLKYRAAVEDGILTEQESRHKQRLENNVLRENAAFQNRLLALNEQRESILENEALTETQRGELLSQFRVLEAQAKYTHEQNLTDIEEDAAQARIRIAEQEGRSKLAVASGIFSNLSSLMNTESRKLFEIGKVAATANAIVEGIEAVQSSYRFGARIGGPPLGAAFAASAAVATLANVKAIQSTQYGSRGTGQSYSGGQVVNNVASPQQTQQQNISINLAGSANYTGGDIRALIDAINDQTGDGYQLNVTGG